MVDSDSSPNENAINDQVAKLIRDNYRSGNIPASVIQELRRKYNDETMVDKIQETYYDKMSVIRRRALKFIKLVERKYGNQGYPLHVILNKALKYKKKYNLSEPEFELFRQQYEKTMNIRNHGHIEIMAPNTNMAKVFGDPSGDDRLVSSEGDYKLLKEIASMYEIQKTAYSQVVIQTLLYSDLASQAIDSGIKYDRNVHDATSFIHPVIVAMFVPKIQKFDEYFLLTNLAYIVKNKQAGEPIDTYHNYIMLYQLVTEPTDIVCNADSPLKDILQRVALQFQLYKNVLSIRTGRVFDTAVSRVASDFIGTIDICRISSYDAPDMIMVGDESVILRRILSSFAFRSVTVMTSPLNFGSNISALNYPIISNQVMKIPMINVRLPYATQLNNLSNPIDLATSLTSYQYIFVNGRFEPRMQQVIYIEGAIIFNVPRRTYQPLVQASTIFQPTNFSTLPKHAFGLEKLNTTEVQADIIMDIPGNAPGKQLFLRSAVCLKTKEDIFTPPNAQQYVVGSSITRDAIIGSETHLFKHKKANKEEISKSTSTCPDIKNITQYCKDNTEFKSQLDSIYSNLPTDYQQKFVEIYNELNPKIDGKEIDTPYPLPSLDSITTLFNKVEVTIYNPIASVTKDKSSVYTTYNNDNDKAEDKKDKKMINYYIGNKNIEQRRTNG